MTALNRKITIVIPTFQAVNLIEECIQSIRNVAANELGDSVFVRVQDGCSGDGIIEYIEGLSTPGISITSGRDYGIYDAMNKAVQQIDTPWVFFLGADDKLAPTFMKALPLLESTSTIYYGNVEYTSNQRIYDGEFTPLKLVYRNICHQAVFYPTALLLAHPYDKKYAINSDWATNIKLMSKYPFHFLDHLIAIYNNQDGVSRRQADEVFNAEKNKLFQEAFGQRFYLLSATAPLLTKIYHFIIRFKR
ncbi:MAG: glycosyltransferase [Halioglobus sp.]